MVEKGTKIGRLASSRVGASPPSLTLPSRPLKRREKIVVSWRPLLFIGWYKGTVLFVLPFVSCVFVSWREGGVGWVVGGGGRKETDGLVSGR